MLTIGLTGGVATGKSAVAVLLRERHGAAVIDADQVAREIVAPGQAALDEIVSRFGSQVLQDDGTLDRAALRRQILASERDRRDLEGITHPRIGTRILEGLIRLREEGQKAAFVEAALMVETGSFRLYDQLWVVICGDEQQVRRLMDRDGVSEEEALSLIAVQSPLSEKVALADRVIPNEGTLGDLAIHVAGAWLDLGL